MSSSKFEALLSGIRENALPISELDTDMARDRIMTADIIWGYDPRQDLMPLIHGREIIEDIAKGRDSEFGYLALLCFEIDIESNDQELLREAVARLKGF